MGIEGIIAKIESETDKKISELRDKNEEAIREIRDADSEFEGETIQTAEQEAQTRADRRFEQVINREEAKLRKDTLETKRKLMEETFEKGKEAILDLPPNELRRRYAEMIESYGENGGRLIVGKADEGLFGEEFMKLLNEKIPDSNFEREISGEFDHGFMLITGRIRYDARLSELYRELKEDITDEVADILFGDKK